MKKLLCFVLSLIIIASCLASCELIHTALKVGEHSCEYIVYEIGHHRVYICGCPTPDIIEEHYDHDGDWNCDACGYDMLIGGAHEFEYVASEEGHCEHMVGEACNGTCNKSPHEDLDGDLFCDICGYNIYPLIPPDIAPEYSLTMNDEEWLYEALEPSYKVGKTVTVKIKMALDIGYLFLVNGEKITDCKDVDGLYWEFTFTMPNEDVVIDFKTYDGFLSDANYALLIEAHWLKYPDAPEVSIRHYYGEFASGAIVAMVDAGGYTEACWSETVEGYTFNYIDGNRITVLYESVIYTLEEAYKNGCLTTGDLAVIAELHRGLFRE